MLVVGMVAVATNEVVMLAETEAEGVEEMVEVEGVMGAVEVEVEGVVEVGVEGVEGVGQVVEGVVAVGVEVVVAAGLG